jgi:predicted transposase
MKLTLQIQLLPDKEQAAKLKCAIEQFNEACSWLAKQAFESKTANKITLQQKFYYHLREKIEWVTPNPIFIQKECHRCFPTMICSRLCQGCHRQSASFTYLS